jgi:hypothetical protein
MTYQRYKSPAGPIGRRPGRSRVAFPEPKDLRALELLFLQTSPVTEPSLDYFDKGLMLAHSLVLARSKKEYRDDVQITATALAFRAWNDLLGSGLLTRAGYAAQSFPLLRSSLENAEVLDFLERNRDALPEYLEGRGRFDRNKGLSWRRKELPQPDFRAQLYDVLNYQSHSNIRGIAIFGYTKDIASEDDVLSVGPVELRDPQLSPFKIANALVSYPTRALFRMDPEVAPPPWRDEFEQWDKGTGRFLEEDMVLETSPEATSSS